MVRFRHILLVVVIATFNLFASSQDVRLIINQTDSTSTIEEPGLFETRLFTDSSVANDFLLSLTNKLRLDGYMTAGVDEIKHQNDTMTAWVFVGTKYQLAELRFNENCIKWLNEMGSEWRDSGATLKPKQFVQLREDLLAYGENHGFPFATVQLEEANPKENQVSGKLVVHTNRYFAYDTISIQGDASISKAYLQQYLQLPVGESYDERKVRQITSKIQKLPFVRLVSNPAIRFIDNKAVVFLYLEKRSTDQFDGIIGFAPNTQDALATKLLITGEVNIDLNNLFKRGMMYNLHWKSFAAQSQELRMGTSLPFLFSTPLGLDGNFEYFKLDSQFFTVKTQLGVRYNFNGTDHTKFYLSRNESALIAVDTNFVRNTGRIPESNPVTTTSYGMSIQRTELDNILNPRKGYRLDFDANVGNRRIQKDIRIDQVLFPNGEGGLYSVYDSIDLSQLQYQLSLSAEGYVPLGKKSTLVGLLEGRRLFADQIFLNDVYRIGGAFSLRGFNEQSLLASSYAMLGLEYRYLLGSRSYFQLFCNGAYTLDESEIQLNPLEDLPFGFGAGLALEVNSGMLYLSYALGREQNNPIQLNQAKIHFGVINFL